LIVDIKMSNHRANPTTSSVQLAFTPDSTPNHCGYCNTNGSYTAGLCLSSSISLRKIHSSNCGYCQCKNEKISFGKKSPFAFEMKKVFIRCCCFDYVGG
jgi:hypothetical protein